MSTKTLAQETEARHTPPPSIDVARIPLEKIKQTANPRGNLPDIDELADSIRRYGLWQPIVVYPAAEAGLYEIDSGNRRHAAWQKANPTAKDIPAVVAQGRDTARALSLQTTHIAWHPLAEAREIKRVLDAGGDLEELAATIGHDRRYLRRRLQLLDLDKPFADHFEAGKMTLSQALMVAGQPLTMQQQVLKNPMHSRAFETKAGALIHDWTVGISVQDLYHRFVNQAHPLDGAPWDVNDDNTPGGACLTCPKLATAEKPDTLFAELSQEPICTDPECWQRNKLTYIEQVTTREKDPLPLYKPEHQYIPKTPGKQPKPPVKPTTKPPSNRQIYSHEKRCPDAVNVLTWPNGDNLTFCGHPKTCKVHGNPVGTGSSGPSESERQQRRLSKAYKAAWPKVVDQLADHLPDLPNKTFLTLMVDRLIDVAGWDACEFAAKAYGYKKPEKNAMGPHPGETIRKKLKNPKPQDVWSLACRLFAPEPNAFVRDPNRMIPKELRAAAIAYGVPVPQIEAEAWDAVKPKATGRPRKAAKKKAPAAGKKKAAKKTSKAPAAAAPARKAAKKTAGRKAAK